jgi:hypothetical protein
LVDHFEWVGRVAEGEGEVEKGVIWCGGDTREEGERCEIRLAVCV